jgi:hypothetical protein
MIVKVYFFHYSSRNEEVWKKARPTLYYPSI